MGNNFGGGNLWETVLGVGNQLGIGIFGQPSCGWESLGNHLGVAIFGKSSWEWETNLGVGIFGKSSWGWECLRNHLGMGVFGKQYWEWERLGNYLGDGNLLETILIMGKNHGDKEGNLWETILGVGIWEAILGVGIWETILGVGIWETILGVGMFGKPSWGWECLGNHLGGGNLWETILGKQS